MKSTITQSIKILLFLLFSILLFSTETLAQMATVETNKSDYAPGSYVIITGSNWQPGETVKLTLVETPLIHPEQYLYATADGLGNIYNSEYLIEDHDLGQSFTLSATGLNSGLNAQALFTDASTTANLDQVKNGTASSPIPGDWTNGNLNSSQAHYGEGWSIPYRMTMEGLSIGTHELIIQWDTKKSGKSALDYITSYNNIDNPTGSHLANFGHLPETIDPTIDPVIPGLGAASTFPIPAPSSLGSSVVGQPTASFNALPVAKRQMTIYNGTITGISYVSEGSLANSDATTILKITFTAANSTVILAWGGHVAAEIDWGIGGGGSAINGSPYHTSLVGLDGGNGGQDRSLSASSVIIPPRCSVSGPINACIENNSLTYTSTIINPNSEPVTYAWSLINNTAGAIISGSSVGSSITVVPIAATFISGGSFNVQLIVTRSGISNNCYLGSDVSPGQNVTIAVPQPCVIYGSDLVCPSSSNTYSAPAVEGFSYFWEITSGTGSILGANNQNTLSVLVGGACDTTFTLKLTTSANGYGCSSTCEKIVTVKDTTAPTFTAPANVTIYTSATCTYDKTVTATGDVTNEADNCSTGLNAIFTDAEPVAIVGCQGGFTIARTWSLVDNCTNAAANQVQTITVRDNTVPTFTRPIDVTIYTAADCSYDKTITKTGDVTDEADNCSTGLQATFVDATPVAIVGCQGGYTIARTWSLVDNCTNAAADQVQTITVRDNTVPTFTRPIDVTIYTAADCSYDKTITKTGDVTDEADNCSTNIQATFVDAAPVAIVGCQGGYTIARTWSLVDNCTNAAADQVQTITVRDNTVPTFTRPIDVTIYTAATCTYDKTVTATGDVTNEADNCSTGLQATFVDATPVAIAGCEGGYTIARTWSLSDNCANAAADQVQTITIRDNTVPTFTRPNDVTIYTSATCTYDKTVTATGDVTNEADNCSTGLQATFVDANPVAIAGCQGGYTIARTWSLSDNCANAAVDQVQTITIRDNTVPTFTRPNDVTIYTSATCTYDKTVTATGDVTNEADNCSTGLQAIFVDATPVAIAGCQGGYTIARTWSLSDNCANAAENQVQTITIRDNTAPTLAVPANTTAECSSVPPAGTASALDNCDTTPTITFLGETTTKTNTGACTDNNYTLTRTWKAEDSCGNFVTKSQTIKVQDTKPPTSFTRPANITVESDQNCLTDISTTATGTVTNIIDNCDPNPSKDFVDGDCFGDSDNESINAGVGNYFPFTVSGYDGILANAIEKLTLAFETNQGKGRAEFTLVSPNGQAVILVGPYCTGGACDDATSNTKELYLPVFYPNSSGYPQWNNNNFIQNGVSQNFTPNGGLTSPNTVSGVTSYVSSFENLTGPMNGDWFIYSRKQASVNGSIDFKSVCLTPSVLCENEKLVVRHWTVRDACNNAVKFDQVIRIIDKMAPTFTKPADKTIYTDGNCQYNNSIEFTGHVLDEADNCSTGIQATYVDGEPVAIIGCQGGFTIARTWSLTDNCGNKAADQIQTITIRDNTVPTFTAPADKTIYSDATCTYNKNIEFTGDVLDETDNCSTGIQATYIDGEPVAIVGCQGGFTIARTWSLTDNCGNSAIDQVQTITIRDNTAPTFTAPVDKTIYTSATCTYDTNIEFTGDVLDEIDNCSTGIQATYADGDPVAIVDCHGGFTIARTWSLTDNCGNSAIDQIQTITIRDNTTPNFTAPADKTIYASSTCTYDTNIEFTGDVLDETDNCSNGIQATYFDGEPVAINGCQGGFTIARTWSLTDNCGNSAANQIQTITILDNTPPTITVQASNKPVECDGQGNQNSISEWLANNGGAVASDTCSNVTWSNNFNALSNDCSAAVTVIFTAKDSCGNTASTSATFSVEDSTKPIVPEAPASVTVSCSTDVPVMSSLSAIDNCSGQITTEGIDTIKQGNCANSYVIIRTWIFTDACNNSSSTSQTITVEDTTPPTGTAPANIAGLQCKAEIPVANILDVTTEADNCSGDVTVTVADTNNEASGCKGSPYIVTRTYTLTDCGGNETKLVQTITVEDTTPPTGTAPANIAGLQCKTEIPVANILDVTTEADNCSGDVTVTVADTNNEASGCKGSPYIVTRTYTLTDCGGNETKLVQTITVEDTTPPTGTAPANIAGLQCKAEIPVANVLDVTTEADNCSGDVTVTVADTNNETSGCKGSPYIVTRTYTLTDCGGNETKLVQTITVEDTTPPTGTAPANIAGLQCKAEIPVANILDVIDETDNCSGDVTVTVVDTNNEASGCKGSPYIVTRTYTLTDCGGNTTPLVQTITVEDTTPPTGTAPANIAGLQCKDEIPVANILDVTTEADNCSGDVTVTVADTNNEASGCKGTPYIVTRTYTLTDCGGNETKLVQTITVEDTTPPTGTAPANIAGLQCKAEIPVANILDVTTEADNCSGDVTVTVADTNNEASGCKGTPYIVTRTYTLTDCGGNETKLVQTITVEDTTAPTGTAPANIIGLQCKAEIPVANILNITTEADNCSGDVTVTVADTNNDASGCKGSPYIVTRTYTLTDCGGNETKLVQTITVEDTTGPTTITAYSATVDVSCDAIPDKPALIFVDNCSIATEKEYTQEKINVVADSYSLVRTWIATDNCGNESIFKQIINVAVTNSQVTIPSTACNNGEVTTVNLSSLLPVGTPTTGTWAAVNNAAVLQGDVLTVFGLPVTTPENPPYVFEYKITDADCPRTIRINMTIDDSCESIVLPCGVVLVHNAFSPNGDGINENFIIDNIDDINCYPTNTVEIYNRWGILVFDTTGYNNTSRVFNGISQGRSTISQSSGLPSGVYFYILNYTSIDGNGNIQTNKKDGYLYLTK